MAERITKSMIANVQLIAATQALHLNVERRVRNGQAVDTLRDPYAQDLAWVRCVLSINGVRTRMVYFPGKNQWRKVG